LISSYLRYTLFPYTTLFRSKSIINFIAFICGFVIIYTNNKLFLCLDYPLMAFLQRVLLNDDCSFFLNPTYQNKSITKLLKRIFLDRKSTRLNSSHVSISYAV